MQGGGMGVWEWGGGACLGNPILFLLIMIEEGRFFGGRMGSVRVGYERVVGMSGMVTMHYIPV